MSTRAERHFKAIPASSGVSSGPAFVLTHEEVAVPSYQISPEQMNGEVSRFEQAILETRQQMMGLRGELAKRLGETEATIFDAHLLVLEDRALIEETISLMRESCRNIEQAFYTVAGRYIEAFSRVEDTFIQERVADIKDVARRLVHNLLGRKFPVSYRMPQPSILVARDITPSEAALLEPAKVLGVVTELGGRTGHASIIARALGVPAVVGARGVLECVRTGETLLLNGTLGEAVVSPSPETMKAHGKGNGNWEALRNRWKETAGKATKTTDNETVEVWTNLEGVEDAKAAIESGAEGVGLFRTEYLFLRQERFPGEDEQFEVYKRLTGTFGNRPVTIRTLDLGGDKKLGKYFDKNEKNPFMGYRAIRFCLENRNLFKAQLRALLRASAHGNLRIMFPMISGVAELEASLGVLEEAKRELEGRGVSFDKAVPVGAMIEVPSAALTLDLIAEHCSFVSIGTNDLIQYLLACDRVNDRIAYLYEPSHPAVIRCLKQIVEVAKEKKLELSLCGEVASDGLYLPMLLGLGLRKLSMNYRSIPEIKHIARSLNVKECKKLVDEFLHEPRKDLLEALRPKYAEVTRE